VIVLIRHIETGDKTLEEIDVVFSRPSMDIVRENIANSKQTLSDLLHFRFRKVAVAQAPPRRKSIYEADLNESLDESREKV
jgi:hypothetical protein